MNRPPTFERPHGPPSSLRGEWRSLIQPLRLIARSRRLRKAPRGEGRLAVCLPGFLAPEASMSPVLWYLRALGHDARHWGMGVNRGNPEKLRLRFLEKLEPWVHAHGRAANVVAWSLGGTVAREAARLRPDLIHRVVCYGSPLIGGPKYTVGASRIPAEECDRIERVQEELDQNQPLTVPITTIFSRRDGVVDWRASLDHYSPLAHHVEVRSSHVGLGIDPDVWLAVAEALAP